MGLKEELLAAADIGTVEIDVPEWGRKIRLKAMSGADRDEYELMGAQERRQAEKESRRPRHVRARLAVFSVVDENDQRIFTEADIPALSAKSAKALDRIWDAAQKLNGYSSDETQALEAADAAKKP